MSLLQMLYSNPAANELLFEHYSLLKALEQQKILKVLSFALTKSLSSFELTLHTSISSSTGNLAHQAAIKPCQLIPKTDVIEILSDDEQPCIGNQQKINSKQPVRAELAPIPLLNSQLLVERKNSEPTPTSPENISEETQKKNKTKIIKKQKMEKIEKQETFYQVPVPELDELQTCMIPLMGVSRGVLLSRREALLRRQVDSWGTDARKQKREIRMLGS